MTLAGLFVPLITPFTADGALATDALERLADDTVTDGATGLVALGTTAETPLLTDAERKTVVDICSQVCRARNVPLIVGAGSNATAASMDAVAGLDPNLTAALTVVPYYLRPTEEGVIAHFTHLAAVSPVPLIVYNIPYRTGRTLSADTLLRLAELPNVVGVKHAVGGIDAATIALLRERPADFAVLGGDDLYVAPLLALGASGAIVVSAGVATAQFAELIAAWRTGDAPHARPLGHRLSGLTEALFTEPNPVVVKAVLAAQGRIPSPAVRLPLLTATDSALRTAMLELEALSDPDARKRSGVMATEVPG